MASGEPVTIDIIIAIKIAKTVETSISGEYNEGRRLFQAKRQPALVYVQIPAE